MPDIERSEAGCIALTPDNTSGDVSNQDLRDLIKSMFPRVRTVPQGRLTTESGVPVSSSDRISQSTIYYTPYTGDGIWLFNGTIWIQYNSAEISLDLSGLTDGKLYDVLCYANSGVPALELSAAWTNDTTRADALTTQDGIYVKSGATTRRYLGTIRTTSTTTTEDSGGGTTTQVGGKRFVWNAYNRVSRYLAVIDTTDNWTYSTATYRQANAASGNKVEYVCGLSGEMVQAHLRGVTYNTTIGNVSVKLGIGLDSVTVNAAQLNGGFTDYVGNSWKDLNATYKGASSIGYHYLAWLEYAAATGTTTWAGDNGGGLQSGLLAEVWA